jgi:hypothetical protein
MFSGWTAQATHTDGNRDLELICNGFKWTDSPDEGRPTFSRNLTTEVVLMGDDYQYLWDIRQGANSCDEIVVTLTNGDFEQAYNIKINDVNEWDHDNCSVSLTLKYISPYQEIDEKKGTQTNILDALDKYASQIIIGVIEQSTVGPTYRATLLHYHDNPVLDSNPPPAGSGWTIKDTTVTYNVPPDPVPPVIDGNVTTVYAREHVVSATEPPGEGWTEDSPNNWYRAVSMVETLREFPANEFRLQQDVLGINDDGIIIYDNGVKFRDVLQAMFANMGFAVNSRMFNMGDTTPDANHDAAVYAFTDTFFAELLMYQKSDVKRPSAGENATNGRTRYENVLAVLAGLKAEYQIEDPDAVPLPLLRLEHNSYFQSPVGLNLTVSPYVEQLAGLDKQESQSITIPRYQKFSWQEQTDLEFDGIDIQYPQQCATTESVDVRQELFNNNVVALGQETNSEYSDNGFTLISTGEFDGDFLMLSTDNPLTGLTVVNNPLSWPVLQDKLYRHDGYYATGIINGANVTFESSQETLKTPTIQVTGFSLDQYAAFNPADSVLTPWGTASVSSSSYDEATCTLELELLLS